LYSSLRSAAVPVAVVDIISNWYRKLFFIVRWNNSLSEQFAVGRGGAVVYLLVLLMFL